MIIAHCVSSYGRYPSISERIAPKDEGNGYIVVGVTVLSPQENGAGMNILYGISKENKNSKAHRWSLGIGCLHRLD
jgi:hypothetical protein